jgi:hypothetical protein
MGIGCFGFAILFLQVFECGFTGQRYKEFIDFAMKKGYDANFGKKCWERQRVQ